MRIEVFGCSGGMALGFQRAGLGFDLVIDRDPNAVASYARNLGHRPVQMDAEDFLRLVRDGWRPPRTVELFVADPPCTPWSRAGKREGLDDERDQLRTTVELIRELRPLCWLVANVPGLDDGPNIKHVHDTIGSLASSYAIEFRRLNAASYGVPQHRWRPFWFGRPLDSAHLAWPVPTHGDPRELGAAALGDTRLPWVTCRQALGHLPIEDLGRTIRLRARGDGGHPPSQPDEPARTVLADVPRLDKGGAVLAAYGCGDHHARSPDGPAATITRNRMGDGALLTWPWDRPATGVRERNELSQAQRNGRAGASQSHNAIALTERAAAILQGFPEGWLFSGETKRARWSQIGQAMPPPFAEAVARAIAAWLRAREARAA